MRRHLRLQSKTLTPINHRVHFFLGIILSTFAIITARLFYWQIIKHTELEAVAQAQYQRTFMQSGKRGEIYFSDGQPLVTNQEVYRLYAQPHLIPKEDLSTLAHQLAQIIIDKTADDQNQVAPTITQSELERNLLEKITKPKIKWVSLFQPLNSTTKEEIESLDYNYLGFDKYYQRYYPEASLAAQLLGFVGKNSQGEDIGYFGLEGGLHQELQPRSREESLTADAKGVALETTMLETDQLNGRNVITSINRGIQYSLEKHLRLGIEKYGAKAGEIVVTDPTTGKILGMASWPNFDPRIFHQFDSETYRNPSLSAAYEPGSTFKLLTVASALDAGVITPESVCPNCAGPRQFGRFTIRTWNDQYTPNITVTEALAKSDNVAMIHVAETLGASKFRQYLNAFGIGSAIGIDLQGDTSTPLKDTWAPVELATISFGQGILTTSLQLVQAVGAIANNGELMQLQILNQVDDPISQKTIEIEPKSVRQVIKPETAHLMKKMMVESASQGEAKWTYKPDRTVAGKTGTSQVANPGGYDSSKTIASFIGFAPADQPKFLMHVKLIEPTTSPWAAETAAPLWYSTAEDLYLLLNIPPDKTP